MTARILVAGVGNVFFGDDGFGVEVARRLGKETMPLGVRVEDYGIRGLHLAFDILEGYDTVVVVDALSRGDAPGTVFVLEPGEAAEAEHPNVDAHRADPASMLEMVEHLGGKPGHVIIVGCEPEELEERMGLSASVERGVDEAVRVIRELIGGTS
ncbi:MAG: hydrogenase maturation protease [Polyangiaceae bacterium]